MLAHEIKNPLSGIRGAAQLLESSVPPEDRSLTRLICDETDRIVSLVDRMEIFSDERPVDRTSINIHSVLDHVKAIAQAGFARHLKITESYDPSLPPVFANRDQLVQVFLNLIKNAAEAVGDRADGEIQLTTAYRPGIRLSVAGSRERSRCRWNSALPIMVRACLPTFCRICLIRSLRPRPTDLAWALPWLPRSSAAMAVLLNATVRVTGHYSAC